MDCVKGDIIEKGVTTEMTKDRSIRVTLMGGNKDMMIDFLPPESLNSIMLLYFILTKKTIKC